MKRTFHARARGWTTVALVALAAFGCSKKAGIHAIIPNDRPTVELTAAPVDTRDTSFYAYHLNWSGNDADGRIEYYTYAIDPPTTPNSDTTWFRTTKNEKIQFFSATHPVRGIGGVWRSTDFHVFVIKAYDNNGLASVPKSRAFYSYTIAPTVSITDPVPSGISTPLVTPAVRFSWTGTDPDGQFTQKPVKYKFKLLKRGDPEFDFDLAKQQPDSVRRFYAKTNFASWDSVGGDTTSKQYTGLTPNSEYLFMLIGYDEAGAYSPEFSPYSNICSVVVGLAGTLGPALALFNEFFFFQNQSGGFVPNDSQSWIKLEVPAEQQITFNWFATATPGSNIEWYRWRLDGDVFDETARTNESTDWYHWSQKSPGTLSCTVGPFSHLEHHFLYVEALDNNGLLSIAVISFTAIRATLDRDLLIVDDTRLEPDKLNSTFPFRQKLYAINWPSAAELDTFLYARGGYPWRGPVSNPPTQLSRPGVFAGYSFDTLGTRQGYEIASAGVPLSVLGKYAHIIWLVDHFGGLNLGGPTDPVIPMSTLKYMSLRGQSSTLSTYLFSGGQLWLAGGAAAYASLIDFNARGSRDNDRIYGPGPTIFSFSAGELVPGRMMYDFAHWQSEMACQLCVSTILKSPSAVGGWTNPGRNYIGTITAPDYSTLPARMNYKDIALGDSLPATRTSGQSNQFYLSGSLDLEYIDQPNIIVEDIDPDPLTVNEVSVLDTLMELHGGPLTTGPSGTAQSVTPVMTYYHGVQKPQYIFTGFNIWSFSRPDCIKLVDTVMHGIWHFPLPPPGSRGGGFAVRSSRPGAASARATPGSGTGTARLPVGKTRE